MLASGCSRSSRAATSVHLRLGLRPRHPGGQPGEGLVVVGRAAGRRRKHGVHRQPHLGPLGHGEAGGQDADDREAASEHLEGAVEGPVVAAAEVAAHQGVAHERHAPLPGLLRAEGAPPPGRNAEQVEEALGHRGDLDVFGRAAHHDGFRAPGAVGGQVGERSGLRAQVLEVRTGDVVQGPGARAPGRDGGDPLRVGVAEGPQQHRVHHGEDRGHRADAERQSRDHQQREPGGGLQPAGGLAQVVPHRGHLVPDPCHGSARAPAGAPVARLFASGTCRPRTGPAVPGAPLTPPSPATAGEGEQSRTRNPRLPSWRPEANNHLRATHASRALGPHPPPLPLPRARANNHERATADSRAGGSGGTITNARAPTPELGVRGEQSRTRERRLPSWGFGGEQSRTRDRRLPSWGFGGEQSRTRERRLPSWGFGGEQSPVRNPRFPSWPG